MNRQQRMDPRLAHAAQQIAARQVAEIRQAAIEQITGYKQRLAQAERQLYEAQREQQQSPIQARLLADAKEQLQQTQSRNEKTITEKQALIDGLKSQIAVLEEAQVQLVEEADELRQQNLRLQAEMQNSRKRLEQTYKQRVDLAKEGVLRDFIGVMDNLELAVRHADKADGGQIREGVEATLRQFTRVLEKQGLVPIAAQGQPFDPSLHEAIGTVVQPDAVADSVVHVEQTGYSLGERLVRPARVIVAQGGV